jgi:hypothetical protein
MLVIGIGLLHEEMPRNDSTLWEARKQDHAGVSAVTQPIECRNAVRADRYRCPLDDAANGVIAT